MNAPLQFNLNFNNSILFNLMARFVTHSAIASWLSAKGYKPFDFQREVWSAYSRNESGLLHASTGSGKTLAVWLGVLQAALKEKQSVKTPASKGLRVLWITPMRALAADTQHSMALPFAEQAELAEKLGWQIGVRTGDTSAAERARQRKALPHALVTTPESLSLLLSQPNSPDLLKQLRWVIVDEWHELIASKRGVQLQLAIARLRAWNPALVVWGLSATIGNLDHARAVLHSGGANTLIEGHTKKQIKVNTLLPPSVERFPWSGHLGMRMLPQVIEQIDQSKTSLVFTNTRSQAEIWYRAILEARPDWAGLIAMHHGSLDHEVRSWVEAGLKSGQLKSVICTSSLDLGVDFSPVERVLQIGSAKGVARVLQRAGRSGHAPGQLSLVTLVPTNSLELVEAAALQDAVAARTIEARFSPENSLDVLVQHVVTIALGGQTNAEQLLSQVRGAWAFRELSNEQWHWVLGFVGFGGHSLKAYPEYQRVTTDENGFLIVPNPLVSRRHRMSIGTIVADASVRVQFMTGGRIGSVEESFIGRLKKGDCFLFAGRVLELVRFYDMTAYVRKASAKRPAVPIWNGGKMPLSSELATHMLNRLSQAHRGVFEGPEMQLVKPLLQLQSHWSTLPSRESLVIEAMQSREGHHAFVYPFAGRHAHIGLASLIAWRIGQLQAATFSIAVNDYGFELLTTDALDWQTLIPQTLLNADHLLDDLLQSLNSGELAQRRFREIARISGLVFQGMPGAAKSSRQVQASSSLFFEVFRKYDPENELLAQSHREVLEQELQIDRLRDSIKAMQQRQVFFNEIKQATPFAFPLMVERLREKLSTEKLSDRVARMVQALEAAATP